MFCLFVCSDRKDLGCRNVKDIVCFHAANFQQVVEKLVLDLHEPPMSQVWWHDISMYAGDKDEFKLSSLYKMLRNVYSPRIKFLTKLHTGSRKI